MREKNFKDASGGLKVSEDVIYQIAEKAALEVEGVAALSEGSLDIKSAFLKNRGVLAPISVKFGSGGAYIKIEIVVNHGQKISELAEKVQKNIKQAVQNMTGIVVSRVDVSVKDLVFTKE